MPNAVTMMSEFLPSRLARDADQRYVLRLPARRRIRRLSGGLDNSAIWLAQRFVFWAELCHLSLAVLIFALDA